MQSFFSRLLESELQQAVKSGDTTAQASFLGISAGHLSRLKNGKLGALGDRAALKLALKLRPNDANEANELARALQEASVADQPEEAPTSLYNVPRLFQRLSGSGNPHKSLLLVSYGDLPRTDERSRHSDLLKDAAEAVAAGVTFVMVNPFGCAFRNEGELKHTLEVRQYLERHYNWTNRVYRRLRDTAAKLAEDRVAGSGTEAGRRVLLYERQAVSSGDSKTSIRFYSGITTRTFFARYTKNIGQDRDEQIDEIWEWVAGYDEDVFLRRDPESLPPNVMFEQFHPITTFYRIWGRFPLHEDFDDFHLDKKCSKLGKLLKSDEADVGSGFIESPWALSEACSEYLSANPSSHSES